MTTTKNERGYLSVGAGIALGVLALILIPIAVYALSWSTAGPRGALDERNKTIGSGDYRIAAYDHFHDLCGAIQAKEDAIENTKARDTVSDDSKSGFTADQKGAILLSLNNVRNSLIRQYNADATKADTQAHFLASDLPYQINKNGSTTCAAS